MPNDSKIYGFDKQDAQRISNIVPYAEGLKRQGISRPVNLTNKINATVYAELLSEPDDAPGFWSAREVVYSDVSWGAGGTGKQFNGTDFPYLRHYNWDTAEKGQVVKAFLVVDTSNGLQEWVFDTDITNPESFVFYGEDNGGVGQARAGGLWKMKKGGSVLTNVGTVEIPDIIAQAFPMTDNQKCYIEIKFGDLGYGFELKEVNIKIDVIFGQYWEEKPDGELIVKWPIAELVKEGDIVKLKQFWSGDIHLEIFGTATDEDDDDYDDNDPYDRSKTRPTVVIGDNKWIIVNKFGNTYQVTHQLPNPEQPRDSFKCFNNLLDCNQVNFASFSDVSAWANALLAKINEFKFDTRGHIYQRLDCDGNILDDYGDDITEEYELLTSTLTSNLVGSDIRPEDVGGEGITCDYKIFNQGNNFTDWIGVKTVIVGVTNGNGQAMFFDIFNIADIGMKSSYSELASNNAGTSGFNDPLFFGTRNFRFNDTLTLQVSVVGKGLLQVKQHSTASVSVTHTLSATTFRDMNEDGATAISFNASYSIGSLGTVSSPDIWDGTSDIGPYLCEFNVLAPDGTQAQYALGENTQANLKNGPTYLELDNTSATGTFDLWIQVNQGASDDPVEDFIYGPGDTYQLCTKLRQVREWTEANVNSCDVLSYSEESTCITDQDGRDVTDGSNDCITQEEVIQNAVSITKPNDSIFEVSAERGRASGTASSVSHGVSPHPDWISQTGEIKAGTASISSSTSGTAKSLKTANIISSTNCSWDWINFDLSLLDPAEPLAIRVGTDITTSGGRTNYDCYICYYSGAWAEDGADVVNWSKLKVTNPGDINTTALYYDVSVLFSLADTSNVWIALIDELDLNGTDLNVLSPASMSVLTEGRVWGTLL